MINYLKSEQYRLLRKKTLHITSLVCLLLIVAAATVLYYFQKADPNFPYATSSIFLFECHRQRWAYYHCKLSL